MADNNMKNSTDKNQTMQNEQAKAGIAGDRKTEQGGITEGREKSAIGGGENRSEPTSQTGETGRARNELDQDKNREFDKNKSEPTSR